MGRGVGPGGIWRPAGGTVPTFGLRLMRCHATTNTSADTNNINETEIVTMNYFLR